jgi:hypothetical protein
MAKTSSVGERIILKMSVDGDGWGGRIKQMIKSWAASGMSEENIYAKLSRELSSGGSVFESIMKGFGETTGQAVDYVSIEQAHDEWDGEDAWMWVSRKDARVCDEELTDCVSRDGVTMSWEEWEAMGLPGTGTTTCRYNCRCSLVPDPDRTGEKPTW